MAEEYRILKENVEIAEPELAKWEEAQLRMYELFPYVRSKKNDEVSDEDEAEEPDELERPKESDVDQSNTNQSKKSKKNVLHWKVSNIATLNSVTFKSVEKAASWCMYKLWSDLHMD